MFEQYIASLNSCRKCASIKPTREFAKWRIFAESEFQKPPTPLKTLSFRVLADASKLTTPAKKADTALCGVCFFGAGVRFTQKLLPPLVLFLLAPCEAAAEKIGGLQGKWRRSADQADLLACRRLVAD